MLILLEIPRITFAQTLVDGYPELASLLVTIRDMFLFIGLPLLCVAVSITIIYIIIIKIRDKKRMSNNLEKDNFFKDDRNFISPTEAKSADTPKLLIVVRLVLLAYGLGWLICEVSFFGLGMVVFMMDPGAKLYEFLLVLLPLLFCLPFLVAVSIVNMKQKEVWAIILLLAIFSLVPVFLDSIVIKLTGISTSIILLACLLTKQVRIYYFENQLRSRSVNLTSFLIIGLIFLPILLAGGIYWKSIRETPDHKLSSLIEKGDRIIEQHYFINNKLPDSIDEIVFFTPKTAIIIEGTTFEPEDFTSFTPEEKEFLSVFLKKKELTYQKTGEKSYELCVVFKKSSIWGEEQELNTNPYYHEKGWSCFEKNIEDY